MEKESIEESRELKREGTAPTTQAGPFVREEIEHIREGKHGARSTKQAVAIGLSTARRAGVKLPSPAAGRVSERTRWSIESAKRRAGRKASPTRARAAREALKREGRAAAARAALARQARSALRARTPAQRAASAQKAARTKGAAGRSAAARKAARTRKRRG